MKETPVYKNYLDDRRQEVSNFLWVSRRLDLKKAYNQGSSQPTPNSHKEVILKSLKIQELVEVLSRNNGVPKHHIENEVVEILDEIGYNKSLKLLRWLALILTKICLKVSSGIYVNIGISKVKNAMGHCPVVFVPSHRSYADFILMSYVCFTSGIEIPAIAAGMDFHGMWGMGSMLRDTGAFFMRRSYNDDNLYWTIFRQYIYQLVTNGDLPIEFFIEGTRSRTNKSLAPKYGLISMVLKPFFLSEVQDILFVPISINYDRILEENLFAFELLGVPKPKESTSGFLKSFKILKEQYGNIYFHFDSPISTRKFFGPQLNRNTGDIRPIHMREISENHKKLIPSLANEIIRKQQENLVLTLFNLIATILNFNFGLGGSKLNIKELKDDVLWLKNVLEFFGGYIHVVNLETDVNNLFEVHQNLLKLVNDKVELVQNAIRLDKINPSRLKAHSLSEESMSYSVPFITLQIYVNPLLSYFVDVAFIVIILENVESLNEDELFNRYHFLRSFFLLEFVTFAPWEKTEFNLALKHSQDLHLLKKSNDSFQIAKSENKKLRQLLLCSFEPFLVSYFVVLAVLKIIPETCDEKVILANVQNILEKMVNNSKRFVHPYCLNLDTLSNCLNRLVFYGLLTKKRRDNKFVYEINRKETLLFKEKLEIYIPNFLFEEDFVLHLDIQNKL